MDLLEAYAGWKKLGTWIQTGFMIGFIGTVASILSLTGLRMSLTNLIILTLFGGFWLLFYGNIQQSRKLTNAEETLGTVDTRIDQATKAVYTQKNGEIEKLKIDAEKLLQSEKARSDNLRRAYIRLRYAYKKSAGITTKEISMGADMTDVKEDGGAHLQQLDEYHLYLDAERLSRENGVPMMLEVFYGRLFFFLSP